MYNASVSAGSPVNSFEFIRPLLRGLDYDLPNASLAVPQALLMGKIFWGIYTLLYPWLNRWWLPQPLILPAEVYKVFLSLIVLCSEVKNRISCLHVWLFAYNP